MVKSIALFTILSSTQAETTALLQSTGRVTGHLLTSPIALVSEDKNALSQRLEALAQAKVALIPFENVGQCQAGQGDCGECQGDCDSDDDCKDGLICFQQDAYDDAPGCTGVENKLDACYDPAKAEGATGMEWATKEAFDDFLDLLAEQQDKTKENQNKVQTNLNEVIEQAFSSCETTFTDDIASDDLTFGGSVNSAKVNHEACRKELDYINSNKTYECGLLTTAIEEFTAPDCTKPERGEFAAYFSNLADVINTHEQSMADKEASCSGYESSELTQIETCNGKQSLFESAACTERSGDRATCIAYGDCYYDALEAATAAFTIAEATTEANKDDYSSTATAVCWLNLLRSEDVTEDGITHCTDLVTDTSDLDLVLPTVPTIGTCESNLVSSYPCVGDFETESYAGMVFLDDCIACAEHVTTNQMIQFQENSIYKVVNVDESQRSYSSVYNDHHATSMLWYSSAEDPETERTQYAWSAAQSGDDNPWVQMNLGAVMQVRGVILQKRENECCQDQYATSVAVYYTDATGTGSAMAVDVTFIDYSDCHDPAQCTGIITFPEAVETNEIKITIMSYNTYPAMRAAALI